MEKLNHRIWLLDLGEIRQLLSVKRNAYKDIVFELDGGLTREFTPEKEIPDFELERVQGLGKVSPTSFDFFLVLQNPEACCIGSIRDRQTPEKEVQPAPAGLEAKKPIVQWQDVINLVDSFCPGSIPDFKTAEWQDFIKTAEPPAGLEIGIIRDRLSLVSKPENRKPAKFRFGGKDYLVSSGKAWDWVQNVILKSGFEGHPVETGSPSDCFKRDSRPFFTDLIKCVENNKYYIRTK